jgi:hypothetical protein
MPFKICCKHCGDYCGSVFKVSDQNPKYSQPTVGIPVAACNKPLVESLFSIMTVFFFNLYFGEGKYCSSPDPISGKIGVYLALKKRELLMIDISIQQFGQIYFS